jgi:hypothetical protein
MRNDWYEVIAQTDDFLGNERLEIECLRVALRFKDTYISPQLRRSEALSQST